MRYGDIVATLDPSRDGRMRMRVAVELAARAHARLTMYYVGPTTGLVNAAVATDSSSASAETTVPAPAADTAEDLRSEFENALKERGLDGTWVLGAGTADLTGLLNHARSADFVIAGISPVPPDYPDVDVEALVVESGRPVLGLPPGRLPDRIGRNIVIAWDGSRAASRAVHDAVPFLHDARSVRLLSIGNSDAPKLLIEHLRRLGERLFGGASRTFLHQMMIPVLISH